MWPMFKVWKPCGAITTTFEHVPNNLLSFLPTALREELIARPKPLFPIGRLDKETSGLVLLTDDTVLAGRLTRSKAVERSYLVSLRAPLSTEQLGVLRAGVEITTPSRRRGAKKGAAERRTTLPCDLEEALPPGGLVGMSALLSELGASRAVHRIVLREGRNRQIHRMMGAVGHRVLALHRESIGGITLEGLEAKGAGHAEPLSAAEEELLYDLARPDHGSGTYDTSARWS